MFSVMVIAGIDLTYKSAKEIDKNETNVTLNASKDSVELKLTSAIPGIVLFTFGSAGLFIMLLKVPAKEIVGYRQSNGGGNGNAMQFLLSAMPKPIFSNKVTNIPLPIWLLIKNKGIFSKVDKNA